MTLKTKLIALLEGALHQLFPDQAGHTVIIEYPADSNHGDYSCNIALQLSKAIKKSPREVAEAIVDALEKPNFIQAIEIAGPGFINFFVSPHHLVENLKTVLIEQVNYGKNKSGKGKTIIVEYSSPNTNKPLHLGHARNNFLGMATANLMEANGYEVSKTQNYNDRGVHICKSMLAYAKWGRDTSPESVDKKGDHFVGDYYVKYTKEAENNPSLEDETREMLKKWEEEDPETRALWEKMNGWIYEGYHTTYDRIGSHFDFSTYESQWSEGGRTIVEHAVEEGKAERIEGGALAVNLKASGLGDPQTGYKVLIRSDGTTIYMTQDLQLAVERMERKPIDQLIYVVGNEQDYHFRVLFEVLKNFGYEWARKLYHLSYGMVNLPSGKMKSREGTTVDIDHLLDELEQMADNEITERNMPYEGKERTELTRTIALGALKYFILKVDAKSEILYDPAAALDFQGNTGPYLQYTHARIRSILRKAPEAAELTFDSATPPDVAFFQEAEELALLRKLQLYPEMVILAVDSYRLHLIANYLFELSQALNSFYVKYSVLEAPSEQHRLARLQLISAVAQVLKNGLAILGIEAPERM